MHNHNIIDWEDSMQMPNMNSHDRSGWQMENEPNPIDWHDVALTAICILTVAWWAFDYIERLV